LFYGTLTNKLFYRRRWREFDGGEEDASDLRGDYSKATQPLSPSQSQTDWEWEWSGMEWHAVQALAKSETRGRSNFPIWHTRADIGE